MEIIAKKVLFGEQKFTGRSVGFIELNHGAALNALDTEMLAEIERKLTAWESDEQIALVVIHSENPKAFCAGGDVKKLALETRQKGLHVAESFFTQEYFTDGFVHRYKKPVLAWLDGITMGGGVGLTQGASHRVVTEKTVLSMPEVFIGLFPDVGGSGFLPRLHDGFGYFLGLSGARLSGRWALEMGWESYYLEQNKKRKVFSDLLRLDWLDSDEQNKELLTEYLNHMVSLQALPPAINSEIDHKLSANWQKIKLDFQKSLVNKDFEKVVQLVQVTEGADGRARSLLSQALFFQLAQKNHNQTWEKILAQEWVAAIEMSKGPTFPEGVRAVLIDKDQKPNWPALSAAGAMNEAQKIISSPIDNLLIRRFEAL